MTSVFTKRCKCRPIIGMAGDGPRSKTQKQRLPSQQRRREAIERGWKGGDCRCHQGQIGQCERHEGRPEEVGQQEGSTQQSCGQTSPGARPPKQSKVLLCPKCFTLLQSAPIGFFLVFPDKPATLSTLNHSGLLRQATSWPKFGLECLCKNIGYRLTTLQQIWALNRPRSASGLLAGNCRATS